MGLDGALGADVREVGGGEDVHDAPGVVGLVARHGAADRVAHLAAGAVRAHHVLGPDDALPALVRTGGVRQRHGDRVLALVGDLQAAELQPVVRAHAARGHGHELGEVVEHAGLVDDEMRELADPARVIQGAGAADDVRGVRGVRLPERHLRDAVRLGDDPLGETEGLESLDAAGLDAVGLADREPARPAFHDPGGDARELGQLGCGEHAGGAGAHDQHIYLVGKVCGPVDAGAGGRLDSRVTGYVAVVVEMHGLSSLRCVAAWSTA